MKGMSNEDNTETLAKKRAFNGIDTRDDPGRDE